MHSTCDLFSNYFTSVVSFVALFPSSSISCSFYFITIIAMMSFLVLPKVINCQFCLLLIYILLAVPCRTFGKSMGLGFDTAILSCEFLVPIHDLPPGIL